MRSNVENAGNSQRARISAAMIAAAGLLGPPHDAGVFTNRTILTRSLDGIGVLKLHCFSKAHGCGGD
jgi:hypothetical protein